MNWPSAFSAGLIRRINSAALGFTQTLPSKSAVGSASATPTKQRLEPSLPPPLEQLLHQRAIRTRNREPRAIAKYMQVHERLHKGS